MRLASIKVCLQYSNLQCMYIAEIETLMLLIYIIIWVTIYHIEFGDEMF